MLIRRWQALEIQAGELDGVPSRRTREGYPMHLISFAGDTPITGR